MLHHVDLGAAIASAAFPDRVDVEAVVRSHVVEDLGHAAMLADWFDCCDVGALPVPVRRRIDGGVDGVTARILPKLPDGADRAARAVCTFLFHPCAFLTDTPEHALPLLMNCVGPMIVRRVFGPPVALGGGAIVDHAWIAEAAIYTAFGRIPDLGEVVRCWRDEPRGRME